MTKPETPREYITIAVPTVVGGVLKLATIPPMDTGRAATLKDMSAWPMAMTIIGSHDACTSGPGRVVEPVCAVIGGVLLRLRSVPGLAGQRAG